MTLADELLVARILGVPVPQGSVRSFERNGKSITVAAPGNLEKWRGDVRAPFLRITDAGLAPLWPKGTPVRVRAVFRFARPGYHYLPANASRAEAELKVDAPMWHTGTPDLDKLTRAVLDALTGILWADDSQVVDLTGTRKVYGNPAGVELGIARIPT